MKKTFLLKLFATVMLMCLSIAMLTACENVNVEVTFIVDDEVYAVVNLQDGDTVEMPQEPTKDGYVFDGWYLDKDIWKKPFIGKVEDTTLVKLDVYAKWVEGELQCNHMWSQWTVGVEPTCAAEGKQGRYCLRCSKTEVEDIEKLPHTEEVIPAVAATCYSEGATEGKKCSVCDEVLVAPQVITKLDHNYGDWITDKEANCTDVGSKHKVCQNEGCTDRVDEGIPTTDHTEEVIPAVAATCHSEGSTEGKKCSVCGKILTAPQAIAKTEHNYGDWVIDEEANCIKVGSKHKVCQNEGCTKKVDEEISITDHTEEVIPAVAATCHSEGSTEGKKCSVCGKILTAPRAIVKTEHNYGDWVTDKEANCTDVGSKHKVCQNKGCTSRVDEEIPAVHEQLNPGDECPLCGTIKTSDGLEYILNEDGESYSVAGIGTCKDKTIFIPTEHEQKPVTAIGESAFYNCSILRSIIIPDGLKSIGKEAFRSSSLKDITISNSVTFIGDYAFYNCYVLTSITIPDSVTSIGGSAFNSCHGLTSVTIGAGVTSMGMSTFTWCDNLQTVIFNGSTVSLSQHAFARCYSLESLFFNANHIDYVGGYDDSFEYCDEEMNIIIGKALTSIDVQDAYLFRGFKIKSISVDKDNTKYHSNNNCLIETESKTLILGCKNSIIPDDGSVTSIGDYSFDDCDGLTSIIIPNSVTSIGRHSFDGCSGLTSVIIGNSVTSIGDWVFYDCSGLTSITIPNRVTSIGYGAFSHCSGLTSITIPNSVTSIGDWAFYDCSGLTSITIPNSVTFISSYAFRDCSGLESITVNEGNTKYHSINNCLIETESKTLILGCKNSIIPDDDSVRFINDHAFEYCSGLTSITIPNSVKSIGRYAFDGCIGLESITVSDGNTKYHSKNNCLIETESKTLILGCKNSIIPDDGSVTSIDNYALRKCNGLTSITIPDSVTSIGDHAFYKCIGLTSVTIGNSVTSIGSDAFRDCSGLTSITIPDSVTSIGDYAFVGCSSLTSVTIPDSVTSIGKLAFYDCSGLTSIIIGNSIASFDDWWLSFGYSGLTSVTIGNGITYISSSMFYSCGMLENITVAEGNTKYHSEGNCLIETESKTLILGCKNSIIPDDGSVTSIGSSAFYGCSGLTSIDIPNSVTSIGSSAFYGCSGLTSIDIPNSVTSIGGYAFRDCSGLTSVTIPNSVTSIGGWAFYDCSALTKVNYLGTIDQWVQIDFYDEFSNPLYCAQNLYIDGELVTEANISTATSISRYAFRNYKNLSSVTIGNSVTSIGSSAFSGCAKLVEVINKSSLNITKGSSDNGYVGNYALIIHSNESKIVNQDGYLFISDNDTNYLLGYIGDDTALVLPSDYNGQNYEIYKYAFYYCTGLTGVTIPDSVTSIRYEAFAGCNGLTSVTIGNGVTSIGDSAFSWCNNLQFNEYDNALYLGNEDNPYLVLIEAKDKSITSCVINNKTKIIASGAFYQCDYLTSIDIPDCVNIINSEAFRWCRGLTSVTIPNSVTSIGSWAFYDCSALTKVNYLGTIDQWVQIDFYNEFSNPLYCAQNLYIDGELVTEANISTATSINGYVFYKYNNLTSVTIGKNVTSIGNHAFSSCDKLVEVINKSKLNITKNNSDVGYHALIIHDGESKIVNQDGYLFISDNDTNYLLGYIGDDTALVLPSDYNGQNYEIYKYAFYYYSGLTSVTIGNGVTSIGDWAFAYCSGLTSVTIGNSVTSIGDLSFYNCSALTSITIPDSVTSIGEMAFVGCSNLTSITIPDSVTSIGSSAFSGCRGLTSVTIGDGVTSIGSSAFGGCSGLTSITIPNSVTSIGNSAFSGCSGLTSVTIGKNVSSIKNAVFYGSFYKLAEFKFSGTIAEWNNLVKAFNFGYNIAAKKVICTDGEVAL